MYGRGENVDSITLTNALSNRGLLDEVGGKAIVHTLAATVPAVANARHYAQIVRDTATYRGLIRAGTEIAALGLRAHRRAAGARRPGRADRVRDRRPAHHRRLREHGDAAQAVVRPAHPARRRRPRPDRHRQRLPPARRPHRRLPGLEPDRARRPPGHGQDLARAQHRRPRRRARAHARGDLLARDVARGGDHAAHVRRGQGRLQAPAPRQRSTRATGRSSPTHRASSTTRRSSSTTPPASRRSRSRPRAGG